MTRFTDAQKQARRHEIVSAARRCFSRNGFHNTTTADIVREAGVSQGTFYLYFKTKDDVIAALADDESRSDAMINAMAAAESDPVAGLTVLFSRHGQTLANPHHAEEHRVTIQGWAEALRDDEIRKRVIANTSRVEQEIARLIARGQKSGRFRADAEPKGVARALVALFRGLTLQSTWEGAFDSKLTAKTIEDMVRGVLLPFDGSKQSAMEKK
ncbi:MAG TPA: TetR/AcrR family transcriptional regulator [Rhizomicrobium sp.]|nr:TetR/AcrR family transcriptional regulator [Rhizomicrobium sp.]